MEFAGTIRVADAEIDYIFWNIKTQDPTWISPKRPAGLPAAYLRSRCG